MKTEQEVIQDRVAEKAKYAASVAAASGNVARNAFVTTVSGATTVGDKAVVFGALVGVVAFCNAFSGAVGVGGYLATASAGAILLGGWLQISERLTNINLNN